MTEMGKGILIANSIKREKLTTGAGFPYERQAYSSSMHITLHKGCTVSKGTKEHISLTSARAIFPYTFMHDGDYARVASAAERNRQGYLFLFQLSCTRFGRLMLRRAIYIRYIYLDINKNSDESDNALARAAFPRCAAPDLHCEHLADTRGCCFSLILISR
jgi:hypothetical protein